MSPGECLNFSTYGNQSNQQVQCRGYTAERQGGYHQVLPARRGDLHPLGTQQREDQPAYRQADGAAAQVRLSRCAVERDEGTTDAKPSAMQACLRLPRREGGTDGAASGEAKLVWTIPSRDRGKAEGLKAAKQLNPMHRQPVYAGCPAYLNGVSEAVFKVGMCLPAGPYVSDDDVRYIVECIKEAVE